MLFSLVFFGLRHGDLDYLKDPLVFSFIIAGSFPLSIEQK